MNIAFIGDLTVDTYPEKGIIRLGGASTNCAIWAARRGAQATVLAAVGMDEAGQRARTTLQEHGVNDALVQTLAGRTSTIEIFVDDKGQRRYGTWEPGVAAVYHLGDTERIFLRGQQAAHLTIYGYTRHLLDEFLDLRPAVASSTILSLDVSDMSELNYDMTIIEKALPIVDFIFVSQEAEGDRARIATLKDMTKRAHASIVVTLGPEGSLVFSNATVTRQKAKHVEVIDDTGAGDAYIAGFLTSYGSKRDVREAMKDGTDLASTVITQLGTY